MLEVPKQKTEYGYEKAETKPQEVPCKGDDGFDSWFLRGGDKRGSVRVERYIKLSPRGQENFKVDQAMPWGQRIRTKASMRDRQHHYIYSVRSLRRSMPVSQATLNSGGSRANSSSSGSLDGQLY